MAAIALWCSLTATLVFTGICLSKLVVQLRGPAYDSRNSKLLWSMLLFVAPPRHRLLTHHSDAEQPRT